MFGLHKSICNISQGSRRCLKKLQLTSSEFRAPVELGAAAAVRLAHWILEWPKVEAMVEIVFGQVALGRSCDLSPWRCSRMDLHGIFYFRYLRCNSFQEDLSIFWRVVARRRKMTKEQTVWWIVPNSSLITTNKHRLQHNLSFTYKPDLYLTAAVC